METSDKNYLNAKNFFSYTSKKTNNIFKLKNGYYFSFTSIVLIILLNILVFMIILEEIKNMNQNIIIINDGNIKNDTPEKTIYKILGKNQMKEENFILKNLIEKASKTKNFDLIINYKKLDNLINSDQRYNGIKRCFVEKRESNSWIYNYLYPRKIFGKKRKLYGTKNDGGYVLLEDLNDIKIAYSFGIGPSVDFDKELANNNIDVYMYDHTITKLPFQNPNFHYFHIGLSRKSNNEQNLKSLEQLIEDNGHINEKNMILKIDIEYNEWESLIDVPDNLLKQFKYILIEFHFEEDFELYKKVLKKLNRNHQIFYIHCNLCSKVKIIDDLLLCTSLEVSYIIKEGNIFTKDDTIYPVEELQTKCNKKKILKFNENVFKFFDYYPNN